MLKYIFIATCLLATHSSVEAQDILPDKNYMQNINGVKLFVNGNQASYPIINVGAMMNLELDFDDLDGTVKTYNYTYQLCNADWSPANLSQFDFMEGFTQGRLSQYRSSSISKTKYIHYQALLPEKSCMIKRSGNYILKVFLNGDENKIAFTRRILVVENLASVAAKITQPYNNTLFKTHQKVQFSVDKSKLNILNPAQQLKVVVLQNFSWNTAVTGAQPVFMKQNIYDYNGEQNFVFPAGKEYRWADLRSFRYITERVESANTNVTPFDVEMKPDGERSQLTYVYYADLNGFYEVSSTEVNNPWWQSDYANVHFKYKPLNAASLQGKNVFLEGEFTRGVCDNNMCQMDYNASTGMYEKTLLLKQGYYSYHYLTMPVKGKQLTDISSTEGNFWETENYYTILVYYRSLSDRADALVAATTLNTRNLSQQ